MLKLHFINIFNKSYSEHFFEKQEQKGYTLDTCLNNSIVGFWHFIKKEKDEPIYEYQIVPAFKNVKASHITIVNHKNNKLIANAKNKGFTYVQSGNEFLVFKRPQASTEKSVYDSIEQERKQMQKKYKYNRNIKLLSLIYLAFIFLFTFNDVYISSKPLYVKLSDVLLNVLATTLLIHCLFSAFYLYKKSNAMIKNTNSNEIRYMNSKYINIFNTLVVIISFIYLCLVYSILGYKDNVTSLLTHFICIVITLTIAFIISHLLRQKIINEENYKYEQARNKFALYNLLLMIVFTPIVATIFIYLLNLVI